MAGDDASERAAGGGGDGTVAIEVRGAVGVVTIERPARRNALNAAMCTAFRECVEGAPELRALVVAGAGTAFCAGADLGDRFAPSTEPEHGGSDTFRPEFDRLLDALVAYPAPVLAAVHGPAIGAGMQLAVACDLRVAAPAARFAIPGGRLGIHLSAPNIARLAALVGTGAARDLLVTGRSVSGADAVALGLVQRAADDPLAAALSLADEIATMAPLTVQGHKRALVLLAERGGLDDAVRAEIAALEARAFASEDLREGMAAFAEKRDPVFRGR